MKETKGQERISARLRNLMQDCIGKSYDYLSHGIKMWGVKIVSLLEESGYFVVELNDGANVWQSNISYQELKNGLKKGHYVEVEQ